MEDLYNSKIQLGLEDTPYNRHYFSKADKPFDRKVYLEKLAPPGKKDHYIPAEEGIKRIRKGLFGYLLEESNGYKMIEETFYEHEKCELISIEFLKFSDPFLSIRKRSPYKEILKVK